MQFGLFSNGQRRNAVARTSYLEDLDEVVLADGLGMREAWISEHGTFVGFQAPDQLPNADLFACKALERTKHIKIGPGIRPLPFYHPLQVATDCATADHLCDGRYMAGFGAGIGDGGGQRGPLPGNQREMMREAIDLILKAWTADEPFDWNGKIWRGKNWHIIPKPLSKPYMEVGIACSRSDSTLELAAEYDFLPLLSWTPTQRQMTAMMRTYLDAAGGKAPDRRKIRAARFIYVTESREQAKKELRDSDLGALARQGRLDAHLAPGQTRADLSMDSLIDSGAFFCGDGETVYQQCKNFFDETGGFGVLLLMAGKDWGSNENRARSMRAFMTEVAPRLAGLEPRPGAAR